MRIRLFTLLTLAAVSLLVVGCGSSRDSDGATSAATTPEAIARATAFVGADRCGGCHETTHTGWAATAHTKKLRDGSLEKNYSNDMQGTTASGRSDFFDGTDFDLGTATNATAFAVYSANAPVLGSANGQAYVKIGGVQYDITYTLGGGSHNEDDVNSDGFILNDEATWKQRYITTVGKSNYILPVQFNQQTQEYVVYHGSDWYDTDNLPLAAVIKNQSYERRCAGCHVTGLEVALDGDEWTMQFSDISVSCEACHGPGGQHAASPAKENIVNPATMTTDMDLNNDGVVNTVDNLIVRNYVCYACHTRGSGYSSAAAGTSLGYPSKGTSDSNIQMYIPGTDWKEYYSVTESTGSYFGGTPDTGFITSKQHHQQQQDLDNGPHGPDKAWDHECFVCHDMHDGTNDGMVVRTLESDGLDVAISSADDNSLCLTCHATHGDFADVEVFDVKTGTAAATNAVVAHAAKRAGKVVGTWIKCTYCHMPKTAKSAVYTTKDTGEVDGNGDPIMETIAGDVSTHTFTIIWPSLSVSTPGLANSCNGCHNGGGTDDPFTAGASSKDDGTVILRDWASSGHGDETAEAWKHYDWDESDAATTAGSRQSCQRCHTATGAMNYLTDPANYDQTANSFGLREGENQVLYCYACHSETPNGTGFGTALHTPGAITADYTDAPTVYPNASTSNVCLSCHTGRESGDSIKNSTADFADKRFVNSHYLTAGGTVFAKSGYHFSTRDYTIPVGDTHDDIGLGTTGNATVDAGFTAGPCATCHFGSNDGSHTLSPFTLYSVGDLSLNPVCVNCHASRGAGTDAANAWLGHEVTLADLVAGVVAPHKGRYLAALEVLKVQLGLNSFDFTAGYPYFANRDWVTVADSTGKLNMGAAFNYNMLIHDPGGVAHNRRYTRRLIYDAIDHLDDGVLNYSVSATLNALDAATTYKTSAISYLLNAQLGTAGDRY